MRAFVTAISIFGLLVFTGLGVGWLHQQDRQAELTAALYAEQEEINRLKTENITTATRAESMAKSHDSALQAYEALQQRVNEIQGLSSQMQ